MQVLILKAVPNTLLIKFFGYLVIKWLSLYHFQLTYTVRSSENWTKLSTQSSSTSSYNRYYIQYNLHVPAGAWNDLYNSQICSKPGEQVTEYYLKFLFRKCWFSSSFNCSCLTSTLPVLSLCVWVTLNYLSPRDQCNLLCVTYMWCTR
jgi:hypothetical protein